MTPWQPCSLCGEPTYDAAEHKCCRFWLVILGERHCVACAESRKAERQHRQQLEERPVGEHDWKGKPLFCLLCDLPFSRYGARATPRCPSRLERRWVTPWEPVPQEQSARSET